jgi:beta-galactosidase/beta-glucuronidase
MAGFGIALIWHGLAGRVVVVRFVVCFLVAGSMACGFLACPTACIAQQYSRGIGVYPGDPAQYDGPRMVADKVTYRNLALHRPAYQSSAYDYNLTAQLVTDGIKEKSLPQWVVSSTSNKGVLGKSDREVFLDGNPTSAVFLSGVKPWAEVDIEGDGRIPAVDHADVWIRKGRLPKADAAWSVRLLGSDDRQAWTEVGRVDAVGFPEVANDQPSFKETIDLTGEVKYRSYRVEFSSDSIVSFGLAEVQFFDKGRPQNLTGPGIFSSAWMSAGSGEEWVSVDLGAQCTFDRVVLSWLRRPGEGVVEISDDGKDWRQLEALPAAGQSSDDLRIAPAARARWVRVKMTKPSEPDGRYVLTEFEVYGRGGAVATAQAAAMAAAGGALRLARGRWRLERASLVAADGSVISRAGFDDKQWMVATVPGTVLTSYLNDDAIANPDFGENQYAISDSYFCADFWYRDEFVAPVSRGKDDHVWLHLDGINWKADVYMNGQRIGSIDGAFHRGEFDVTQVILPGKVNSLAVLVKQTDHPGGTKDKEGDTVNGGALGRDNPTFHASAGWDWMSTIRGRNTGIWNEVRLTTTKAVKIEDPGVTTKLPLPDNSYADVLIETTLRNLEDRAERGKLHVGFGTESFDVPVELDAKETKKVSISPDDYPQLRIEHPRLWWPNGYGDQSLYPVTLKFVAGGATSDETSFKVGLRHFTYSEDGGTLRIWVNGRRFIARGGNWGFSESMLRYRAREYDITMRLHQDQHFNMIRNWVGQTDDELLYDAADRHGIVIWQDFWLANPWDGPVPDDDQLFLDNARDYLLKIRNHASIGLYVGRNEGLPPKPLDDGLRALIAELHPEIHFISSSADGPVSGHGPYRILPLREYFAKAPTKMHSEIGAPNVPERVILDKTLSQDGIWPVGAEWRLHDFHGHNPFGTAVDKDYGGAKNVDEFASLAQFVDYNAYRGMFEGGGENRLGTLIWMSHPAWPSILWQTYDYFYDTDAAYYAAKKASEPIHIQWNAATNTVEVVNYNDGDQKGLEARAQVLDLDGSVKWEKSATVDSPEDSTLSPINLEFPDGMKSTQFIRLALLKEGKPISTNFYWHGTTEEDYTGIRELGEARVRATSTMVRSGAKWQIATTLKNDSTMPALMVRVKVVRAVSGDPIFPAICDDNYIALMPGESQTIRTEVNEADTRGERPRVKVDGYNLKHDGSFVSVRALNSAQ